MEEKHKETCLAFDEFEDQTGENPSFGERLSDSVTPFIALHILLNLVLSCVAALQGPIILMSQNREATRDCIRAAK